MTELIEDVGRMGGRGTRKYCFTLNNYTPEQVEYYRTIVDTKPSVAYIVFGFEVGESGTQHLQGFVYFHNAVKFDFVKRTLTGNPHIEPSRGTLAQAIAYCKKDGNYCEFGKKPMTREEQGQAEVEAYTHARTCAEEGNYDTVRSDIFIRHYSTLKIIHHDYVLAKSKVEQLEKLDNYWIVGPSGIGKSRWVRHHYPHLYDKMLNKWWEGYLNEPNVLLDDMGPWSAQNGGLSDLLKRWADRYPFRAEAKGTAVYIRPERILVTSQYFPADLWTDPETVSAIMRRFQIVHLTSPWIPPVLPSQPVSTTPGPPLVLSQDHNSIEVEVEDVVEDVAT